MLLWKFSHQHMVMARKRSFNPCSLGCCSESQSLLPRWRRSKTFQSLFSWMLLWKTIRYYGDGYPESGFNPCSLGCCSERRSQKLKNRCLNSVSILVLLDVALKVRPLTTSFPSRDLYVSILVLLDVALKGNACIIQIRASKLFQSLFSWMLLWKWVRRQVSCMEAGSFNPCSLGCCSESRWPDQYRRPAYQFQSLFSWMLLWKLYIDNP